MSESDVVIRVEGLGKKYALHHEKAERYTALRDVVARQTRAAGRLLNPFTLAGQLRKTQRKAAAERAKSEEEFWALKDVSFEIRRGERVGIIGRNGAGKSTLLKILSRITEPTTGRVEIRGRVASLLEVGTGFHPELTGRENIYLNGAILGMTRREIRSKFDEIVDFAEVEKFLDTPVKRYSSGMYVRLAFAVAAHLEPEILVVDEVLAVGDAGFQKKCLEKMENAGKADGRTVLFVSHNMSAIHALCPSVILLSSGQATTKLDRESAVAKYLEEGSPERIQSAAVFPRPNGACYWICSVVTLANGKPQSELTTGDSLSFQIEYKCTDPIPRELKLGFIVSTVAGENVLNANNRYQLLHPPTRFSSHGFISCDLGVVPLMEGRFTVAFYLGDERTDQQVINQAISFNVVAKDIWGSNQLPPKGCSLLWWPTKFNATSC